MYLHRMHASVTTYATQENLTEPIVYDHITRIVQKQSYFCAAQGGMMT